MKIKIEEWDVLEDINKLEVNILSVNCSIDKAIDGLRKVEKMLTGIKESQNE